MAKNDDRFDAPLKCSVCGRVNYTTSKNGKTNKEKLELNKFCKFCRKVTPHKETKKVGS